MNLGPLILAYPTPATAAAAPSRAFRATGLQAAPYTGTANTTVGFWTGPDVDEGAEPLASWVTRAEDDAVLGTAWKILVPGRFSVQLRAVSTFFGAATLGLGITFDALPGQLQTDPDIFAAVNPARDGDAFVNIPAGDVRQLRATAIITVSAAQASDPTLAFVRGQFSDLGNNPPIAGTIQANLVLMRIQQIAE